MQKLIMQQLEYPIRSQNLIHGGRVLQDSKYLWDYKIAPLSKIILNLRIRGGVTDNNKNPLRGEGSGNGSTKFTGTQQGKKTGSISFKNILQGKNTNGAAPNQTGMDTRPYIVDQLNHILEYNIDILETDE